MMRNFKLLLVVIALSPTTIWGSSLNPTIQQTSINTSHVTATGYMGFSLEKTIRSFQVFISPVDGDRCSMAPTCSTYSRQVVKKYGAFRGYFLMFDRLLHETDEYKVSPVILDAGRLRTLDPISNNTFWWKK